MSDTLHITLGLPPRLLSPNARCHWAAKAKATKSYRTEAYASAGHAFVQAGMPPFSRNPWEVAQVAVTFYHKDRRRRDRDNALASLKSAFDGLTDAGVWRDDSGVTFLPVRFEVDRDRPRVEITVSPGMTEG